ncbi:putative quinol monooxygenase [Epilithonimonas hominis]|uniref:putative quinol monooxygenase n=1 Tax=Epilithonimonas hominis TaxID=420404 RepID=UPI0028A013D1|nr:antibiotic biosynthesis monooxygenase [Epilithonimonas hominis]
MEKFAILARVEAKPGKENEVLEFLKSALPLAQGEPGTVRWYALQIGPSTFGIFDTFSDEEGREAHLGGKIAKALMENAPELLATAPSIEKIDVLAAK